MPGPLDHGLDPLLERFVIDSPARRGENRERTHERLVDEVTRPTGAADRVIAGFAFPLSVEGCEEIESSYHAIRSAGWPRHFVDQALMGPLAVLAAARWGIDDESFEERIEAVIERTGHARGRVLLKQAHGVRALRRGELAKAEKLLFDAVQGFATLRLDYERAVVLGDHARALAGLGRDHRSECDEAKAIAERMGAIALRGAVEQVAAVPVS